MTFLRLPEHFQASQYTRDPDEDAGETMEVIRIDDLSMAYACPGVQGAHSELVFSDGSHSSLYFTSPVHHGNDRGRASAIDLHKNLMRRIGDLTGIPLVETNVYSHGRVKGASHINPKKVRGYSLSANDRFSLLNLFVEGAAPHKVHADDRDNGHASQECVLDQIGSSMGSHVKIDLPTPEMSYALYVDPRDIAAVWSNYNSMFLLLDNIREPAQLYMGTDQAACSAIERIVEHAPALKGQRISENIALFARPECISRITLGEHELSLRFNHSAWFDLQEYRRPSLAIRTVEEERAAHVLIGALTASPA